MYLDNASTKKISEDMKKHLKKVIDDYFANPSSNYSLGNKSRVLIENARLSVANFINTSVENIIFTSGGSASNTLAIQGYINGYNDYKPSLCYYLPIAHKSLTMQFENKPHIKIPIYYDGSINFFKLEELFERNKNFNAFVCVEYANSEIGIIQDIKRLTKLVHKYNGVIYVDCTGSISSIKLDVKELDIDMAGFSAHKIGALKGCGVFYRKNKNIKLKPLVFGKQEQGLFGGTENILGIASLKYAVENYDYTIVNTTNRDTLYNLITSNIPNAFIVGNLYNRLPYNLLFCIEGVKGEALVSMLDTFDIQISTGSACNNYEEVPSHVLCEIRLNERFLNNCIRITLNGSESLSELKRFKNILLYCVDYLTKKV